MTKKGNKKTDVYREVDILRKLKHSAILAMTDFLDSDNEYVLVTELWVACVCVCVCVCVMCAWLSDRAYSASLQLQKQYSLPIVDIVLFTKTP